jgi:multidrug transporter EmrE-like cation transporter
MNSLYYMDISSQNFDLTSLSWALAAAFVSTTYFFLIKYYAQNNDPKILGSVMMLELLVIYLYYKSLQRSQSGTMYAIINGFSVMLGAFIAVLFFNETLTTTDIAGIIAIIIGIIVVGKK